MKALALAALLALSTPVSAQQQCGPYDAIINSLESKHKEHRIATGWINAKTILVVMSSKDGSSFTVLSVSVNGVACFLATGHGWTPETMPGTPV